MLPITEIGAPDGDVLARYTVRRDEFAASAALAQHIVESHTGPIEYAATLHPVGAPSSGIGIVEGWRGTIVHRVEIDVDGRITRGQRPLTVSAPSCTALAACRCTNTHPRGFGCAKLEVPWSRDVRGACRGVECAPVTSVWLFGVDARSTGRSNRAHQGYNRRET